MEFQRHRPTEGSDNEGSGLPRVQTPPERVGKERYRRGGGVEGEKGCGRRRPLCWVAFDASPLA